MINIKREKREVFWDNYLVDTELTTAEHRIHHPQKKEKVMSLDEIWEGDGCIYWNIIKEDDKYRMYYLARHCLENIFEGEKCRICYAESKDGIRWKRPDLHIHKFKGSDANNIILDGNGEEGSLDNFFCFKDTNPDCPKDEIYKAIASPLLDIQFTDLWCYTSEDGIHFKKAWQMADTTKGTFDSLNTVMWDSEAKEYVCYIRGFHNNNTIRDIRVMRSKDFKEWSDPVQINFVNEVEEHQLYTNCIMPYYRANHIKIGFPSRYYERKEWSTSHASLCKNSDRRLTLMGHADYMQRMGLALTDCLFMVSRDGDNWERFDEAFIDPGIEDRFNWVYGDCYPAYGIIETEAEGYNAPNEMSFYVKDNHWSSRTPELFRYTLRLDGFASRHAGAKERKIVTKPFVFEGNKMEVNFRTSAAGYIYINFLDENLEKIQGCGSDEIFGNSVDRAVFFENEDVLKNLNGKTVRMEIIMKDADVFSFMFK